MKKNANAGGKSKPGKSKAKPITPTTPTTRNQVHVMVVLDRSGSMSGTKRQTVDGYNEYLGGLRTDTETDYTLTLIQFSCGGGADQPQLTVSYTERPLAEVQDLKLEEYNPNGRTPLYDAIGECVRRVKEVQGRAQICVIITDGEENASVEFTKESIKALVAQKEAEKWTFVFLGANIDSYAASSGLGMGAMNTASYVQGHEKSMYANLARSTVTRSSSIRSMGLNEAVKCAMFNDGQREEMLHGGPGGQVGTTTLVDGGLAGTGGTFLHTTKLGQSGALSYRSPAGMAGTPSRQWDVKVQGGAVVDVTPTDDPSNPSNPGDQT